MFEIINFQPKQILLELYTYKLCMYINMRHGFLVVAKIYKIKGNRNK